MAKRSLLRPTSLAVVAGALALGAVGVAPARAQDQPPPDTARERMKPGHCPTCGAPNPAPRCPTCGAPIHTPGAWNDDVPERTPQDEKIDRRLRQTLRREYGDPNDPRTIAPPPPPEPAPPPPPPKTVIAETHDDNDLELKLGLMAAHWSAGIFDLRVASLRNGFGTGSAFQPEEVSRMNLGRSETQLYRAWFDFTKRLGIEGAYRSTVNRDNGAVTRDFDFGGFLFQQGAMVDMKFETRVVDFGLVVHAVTEEHVSLDVSIGGRYVYSDTMFSDLGGTGVDVRQTLEGGMPTVGLGFALRPIHEVEFFARAKVGAWGWSDNRAREDGAGNLTFHRHTREATSVETEAGLKLMFHDTIGIIGGYRFEMLSLLFETNQNRKRADWKQEGPFIGAILQF